MRKFRILTLSDNLNLRDNNVDPISILTAGTAFLQSAFPNLFGANRRALTANDWNSLFPGDGYWNMKLKNALASIVKYDTDLKYLYDLDGRGNGLISNFVFDNRKQICPSVPDSCWTPNNTSSCQTCMNTFAGLLSDEQSGGGSIYPGVPQNFSKYIPYAIGAVVLIAILKNNKKK